MTGARDSSGREKPDDRREVCIMGMMSVIHAAMTDAGVIGRYESAIATEARMTAEIDALRLAPFADDVEYELQLDEIRARYRRRRRARRERIALFDEFAGRVARGGVR